MIMISVRSSRTLVRLAHIHTRSVIRAIYAHRPPAPVLSRLLQAAFDRFAKTVHYCALDTISGPYDPTSVGNISINYASRANETGSDVFHSVGPTVHLALLPQENSIFGIVTETYDLLRSSDVGESRWIRGAVTLPIQHCLMVRRGKTLRDIKKVLSHEQVRAMYRPLCLATRTRVLIFYHTTHRLWDSVNGSSPRICLMHN